MLLWEFTLFFRRHQIGKNHDILGGEILNRKGGEDLDISKEGIERASRKAP